MERQSKASNLQPGTVIEGKFEVRRVLGAGAMGAVVEATHLLRRARVALKFMSQEMVDRPGVVERFLNEGVAASRINNEHVVKVLDVSRLPNGQPYLVMEFLDGEDLQALLTREGRHGLGDVQRAVHFILQVLRGLQVAHQVGIIHRDLKPANCFVVTNDGEPDFIKIVDFGISKVQEPDTTLNLTSEGAAMGTPLYVSPEQARDATRVDARSDIYSVSAMLYELLSGRPPFDSPTLAGLFMQLAMVVPTSLNELRADLPPGLADVVQRGLAKLPEERFQSAVEMAWALAPYSDGRSEFVLRQLVQRPSMHAARSSSQAPPPSGATGHGHGHGHGAHGAALTPKPPVITSHPPAALETRGTAPGVVRAGRGAAEARSMVPKAGGAGRLALILVPLALLGIGGAVAFSLGSGVSPEEKANIAGGDAHAAAQAEAIAPAPAKSATPTREPVTPAEPVARPVEPASSVAAPPVASAKPANGKSTASGSNAVGASSPLPQTSAPPEPAPARPPNSKPALSKIGVQD